MKFPGRGARRLMLGRMLLAAAASTALAAGAVDQAAAALPSAVGTKQAKPKAPALRPDATLSNETTNTTWTIADVPAVIRSRPSGKAPVVARLRSQTPDGYLQSYILLSEHWTSSGPWVKLRVPGRPNGRIGWVPRGALDGFQRVHTEIVVNRSGPAGPNLTLYRNGRAILHAPVGIGKASTPTPTGHFWVTEAFPSYDPFYGPFLLATSDYSVLSDWPGGGVIGIHGTNEPALVPGYPSHGCIRMHNSDILRVAAVASTGTPVLVR
jgi:lipoprotein-anchoring transpeptidase ErfK/SrfK